MISRLFKRVQSHLHPELASGWPSRLLRGSSWSLAGTFGTYTLKILSYVIVARILGAERFGKFGMVQITVAMFNIFAGFGLGVTATKHIAELRSSDPIRSGEIIGLTQITTLIVAAICSIVVYSLAPWLAKHVLASQDLTIYLRISTIALFFGAINGAQTGVLSGFEAFKVIAHSNFISAIFGAITLIYGTYLGGLTGAIIGYGTGFAIRWAIFYTALTKTANSAGITPIHTTCFREARILWGMALPATLSGLLVTPVNWACRAMLVRQANGFTEMGILSAASQWQAALMFLPSLVGGVAIPLISERVGVFDFQSAQRLVRRLFQGYTLMSIPLIVILSVASPWIMNAYRPEYKAHWMVLIISVLSATFQTCQGPVLNYLEGTGRMWSIFIMNIFYSLILLLSSFMLVKSGAVGLAWASLIAIALHSLWVLFLAFTTMKHDRLRGSVLQASELSA